MASYINVILTMVTLWDITMSTRADSLHKNIKQRARRATDITSGTSTIPDLSALLNSQSNIQAAYFLGQCLMCPPGPQGPTGQQGARGMPGRDGRDAILVSSSRDIGTGLSTEQRDRYNFSGDYVPLGAKYTRWGKPYCPNDTELIYEGVVAGSLYTHKGGASNYICLTKEPIFNGPVAGFQHNAFLYGAEYETSSFPTLSHLQDAEVPCAICLATSSTIVLMVPGRNECPPGDRDWKLEYKGFLMSQHYTHTRTEYICVDEDADGIARTSGSHNGALLYIVEAQCLTGGGLPCPPYTAGYEVTCAVCSL